MLLCAVFRWDRGDDGHSEYEFLRSSSRGEDPEICGHGGNSGDDDVLHANVAVEARSPSEMQSGAHYATGGIGH